VSNKDVKQDALDNLADALTEDILNTPDHELLREVEEDYGDPRALANKFDQILERAEKQVFGTARSAASPQVRSSVLDLPISLPDKTTRWVKGIFGRGSRLSEFLSSLRPRTLAWSATAAAVAILVQAAVITALLVKEQERPMQATFAPAAETAASPQISDEEMAALVAGARQLLVAGDIPNARLALRPLAEIARNAAAALELGATFDPTFLQPAMTDMGDVRMARLWYEKAKDLGSTEAAVRLERLRSVPNPRPGAMSDD
jgi:hypothetical protein